MLAVSAVSALASKKWLTILTPSGVMKWWSSLHGEGCHFRWDGTAVEVLPYQF